jgi:site-specific recombinase XerD
MQGYVKAIKLLFGWLADEEVIAKSPAARLQKALGEKRLRASFSDEHLSLLFGVCDLETPLGFRDYTLMLVLLDTGVRVEEICRLTLDDLHDDYLKIHGKGRKEREVGFTPTTAKFLWKYINLHRAAESEAVRALFTNIRGRQMSPSGIEQIFDKIAEVASLGEDVVVTPHKLRHTFARTWLERGGDVYSLSRLMGHSSVNSIRSSHQSPRCECVSGATDATPTSAAPGVAERSHARRRRRRILTNNCCQSLLNGVLRAVI